MHSDSPVGYDPQCALGAFVQPDGCAIVVVEDDGVVLRQAIVCPIGQDPGVLEALHTAHAAAQVQGLVQA